VNCCSECAEPRSTWNEIVPSDAANTDFSTASVSATLHLGNSIRLGVFCVYSTEKVLEWRL
jgi:hypothetical protein